MSFDRITDIPRYVEEGHYQTKMDDKSGYDHILLTEESRQYFGLYWKGWYFVYNTIPFGWGPSAYVYHTVGVGASHHICTRRVPFSQHINDCHIGQLRIPIGISSSWSNFELSAAACFITSLVLVSCGYFIGLQKSVFLPVQIIPFLGFLVDSVKQAFILPEEKKQSFANFRDYSFNSKVIPIKSLQKFAGKAVSFSLAVPAAKLYCREVNYNISKGLHCSRPVKMSDALREESQHWQFLDSWSRFLPWRQERHFCIKITTDASNSGWGGILKLPGRPKVTRDYWCPEDLTAPGGISVKEAKALFQALSVFSEEIYNGRVDAYVENLNLINFWNNEGGTNVSLSNEIKELFLLTLKLNIILNLHYVASKDNSADSPSKVSSDPDCSLTNQAWRLVEASFGPHAFDSMALPSNDMKSSSGEKLKFFSPFPFPESSGVNVFSQNLTVDENYYVFPPFISIGPLLRFLKTFGSI